MKRNDPKFRFLLEAPTLSFIHFLTGDGAGGSGSGGQTFALQIFSQRVRRTGLSTFQEVQELSQKASKRVFLQGRGARRVLVY